MPQKNLEFRLDVIPCCTFSQKSTSRTTLYRQSIVTFALSVYLAPFQTYSFCALNVHLFQTPLLFQLEIGEFAPWTRLIMFVGAESKDPTLTISCVITFELTLTIYDHNTPTSRTDDLSYLRDLSTMVRTYLILSFALKEVWSRIDASYACRPPLARRAGASEIQTRVDGA